MKRFLYLTVCFFILGKFYGCNGDVFVDDFRSSDSELTLDGNGDVATIQFAAANWDWMYVAFDFPYLYCSIRESSIAVSFLPIFESCKILEKVMRYRQ